MHESHGELMIGGATLHRVPLELEQQVEPLPDACDWQLAGQLHVTPEQAEELELDRHYRLQLEDGRAGPIVLTRVEPQNGELRAAFRPHPR